MPSIMQGMQAVTISHASNNKELNSEESTLHLGRYGAIIKLVAFTLR